MLDSDVASQASLVDDLRNPSLISFLDFSRWMAAAIVFLGHLRNPLFIGYSDLEPSSRTVIVKAWYFVTGWHAEAVIVFFVLSGLLVAGVGLERLKNSKFSLGGFAVDRFSRLYVAFLPALLFCFLLDSLGSSIFESIGFWNHQHPMISQKVNAAPFADNLTTSILFKNALMMQHFWTPSIGSNQPLWTISTEFWFYTAFGVAASMIILKPLGRSISLLIFAGLLWTLGLTFLILLGFWLIGMSIGMIPRRRWITPWGTTMAFLATLATTRLCNEMLDQDFTLRTLSHYLVAILFSLIVSSLRGRTVSIFKNIAKLNRFLADFSYSLYLLHFPLMLFLLASAHFIIGLPGIAVGYSPRSTEGVVVYASVIFITYVLSWGFSRLTEAKTNSIRGFLKRQLGLSQVKTPKVVKG